MKKGGIPAFSDLPPGAARAIAGSAEPPVTLEDRAGGCFSMNDDIARPRVQCNRKYCIAQKLMYVSQRGAA
jgi:hypothetical protein